MPEILRDHFQLKETIVTILAREAGHIDAAKRAIRDQRASLEDFIGRDPFFQITLEPYDPGEYQAPAIVQQMIKSSAVFGIGPMATVAGAIAGYALAAMMEEGATYAVVDNGGDICILNDHPIIVGIYAGSSPIKDLAFEISPRKMPLGICTSSGTVGPSISFGWADAALVVSQDVVLADAAATALGNAVTADGPLKECFAAIDRPGIDGALVVRGGEMAMWKELPPLHRARMDENRITRE
ncbi:MAG: UPF0280 family protein [Methanothrix sp.]|nr:UPF0280 family protein [Methanothrix sp.]OYV11561.1 MAG: hypothetical protein CG446_681 [Methanosaeta sp. ASO1]